MAFIIHMKRKNNTVSTIVSTTEETDYRYSYVGRDGTVTYQAYSFNCPSGVAVGRDGNRIVADFNNHRIRKITPKGDVSTLAGTGQEGHKDGEGTVAQFNYPTGVAVDADGNVLVGDTYNHCIRRITPQGQVSTLVGTGQKGHLDGEGTVARFNCPTGVSVDGDGNILVGDTYNHCVRKIVTQPLQQGHQVITLAGTGKVGNHDGEGTVAQFNCPTGLAVDGDSNVIVADTLNHNIRKITHQGHVSNLAGNGSEGFRDKLKVVPACHVPEPPAAQFSYPSGVAVDGDGNIIVADTQNHCIRTVTPEGHVSTLAGSPRFQGNQDGDRSASARFNEPGGVALDGDGNLIVADSKNHYIRHVAADCVTPPLGRHLLNLNSLLPPVQQPSPALDPTSSSGVVDVTEMTLDTCPKFGSSLDGDFDIMSFDGFNLSD